MLGLQAHTTSPASTDYFYVFSKWRAPHVQTAEDYATCPGSQSWKAGEARCLPQSLPKRSRLNTMTLLHPNEIEVNLFSLQKTHTRGNFCLYLALNDPRVTQDVFSSLHTHRKPLSLYVETQPPCLLHTAGL